MNKKVLKFLASCLVPYVIFFFGWIIANKQEGFGGYIIIPFILIATGYGFVNLILAATVFNEFEFSFLEAFAIILGLILGGLIPLILFVIGLTQIF